MARPKKIKLADITLDTDLQVRVNLSMETIDHYAERMQEGDAFRAVDLFEYADGSLHLADGWHRVHAARKIGRPEISAIVRKGEKRDAVEWALGANRNNGLPLTTSDRVRAVKLALRTFPKSSDPVIAEMIGVHRQTVLKYRHELQEEQQGVENRQGEGVENRQGERIGRDGKTYPVPPKKQYVKGDLDNIPMELPGEEARAEPDEVSAVTDDAGERMPRADTDSSAPHEATDMAGNPLPPVGSIQTAFYRRQEITALLHNLSQVKTKAIALAEQADSILPTLSVSNLTSCIDSARQAIKTAGPWAVCPYCQGGQGGGAADCQACGGRGWVGKLTWDQAPEDMKAAVG